MIIGISISKLKPDSKHPFGHGRAESISAIIIGSLLGIVGLKFLIESVNRLIHYESVIYGGWVVIVFAISILFKEGLAQFSIRAGKKYDLDSLKADGWHHRSDAIASMLILVGSFFSKSIWWLDGVLGIAVSLLIIYAAYDILNNTTSSILGEKSDDKLLKEIKNITLKTSPSITRIHHMHVHKYGENIEVTLHICLSPRLSLEEAHGISNCVEVALKEEKSIKATIHIEPVME